MATAQYMKNLSRKYQQKIFKALMILKLACSSWHKRQAANNLLLLSRVEDDGIMLDGNHSIGWLKR